MKNKALILIIVLAVVTGLYFLGNYLLSPKYGEESDNPYDLKLDSLGMIDKALYCGYASSSISLELTDLKAIAVGEDDHIYVSGEKKIRITDLKGNLINEFETGDTVTALSLLGDNQLIAGVKDHVEIFDKTGKQISQWPSVSDNAYITSLTQIDDHIYAADAESECVYKLNQEGKVVDIYGDSVPPNSNLRFVLPSYYFDVAKDPDGFLWIANTGKHKLINLNPAGELRSYWGFSSAETEGFCGCCNPSHFVIAEDGSFFTSEKGIVRIKKYDAAGQFVCAVAGPEHFKKGSEGLDMALDREQNLYVLEPKAQKIHIFKEN
jgi:sugar lactone lactonase YvrE